MDHCLRILKAASTDTEKMAGLMLVMVIALFVQFLIALFFEVAKTIKSNKIDEEGRRRVFESVGFTFLNRLLATG